MRIAAFTLVCLVAACAAPQSPARLGKTSYPPSDPQQVRFYIDAEAVKRDYEFLAYVTAEKTANTTGSSVEDAEVIAALKQKAAEMGADGIILESLYTASDYQFISGFGGELERKRARARAIRLK